MTEIFDPSKIERYGTIFNGVLKSSVNREDYEKLLTLYHESLIEQNRLKLALAFLEYEKEP